MHPSALTRRRAVLTLLGGLAVSGAIFALGPADAVTTDDPLDTLPAGAPSTTVARQLAELPGPPSLPAVAVFSRADGEALSPADVAVVGDRAQELAALSDAGPPAVDAAPGDAVGTVTVGVDAALSDERVADRVAELRHAVRDGLPPGLEVQVTGAPAFSADLSAVFDGADVTLLLATAAVVAVLLLVTYRSPVLWVVPLTVVLVADRAAGVVAGAVAGAVDLQVDGAAAGILSVLVFGAGTDYALLLTSRYRDELRRTPDRFAAMSRTLRATAPAVLASGGTVCLALLTLLVSDVPATRGLGAACALGVAVAVVAALVVLPAALVLPGRWLFWPFVPRVGDPLTVDRAGGWARLGRAVVRRPVAVLAVSAVALAPLALPLTGVQTGLSPVEQFRDTPEAVVGQQVLARALPGGAAQPLVVTAPPQTAEQVAAAAREVEGVAGAQVDAVAGELALLSVVLGAEPGTDASDRALTALRDRLADVDPAAAVGGETAEALDLRTAVDRDTRVAVPLILAVVLLVLVALLRAVVAPVLLVATVLVTWVAALGAGWLLFERAFGFAALDSGVPLLTFLFLVALGVDYNIFLVTRLREEVVDGRSTADGAVRALAATGGVITSAGVLLAAVFAVLGVLPAIALTQIGVVVGLGVLLDTLLVRTVVVPALAALTGERFWWPARPGPRHHHPEPGGPVRELHPAGQA